MCAPAAAAIRLKRALHESPSRVRRHPGETPIVATTFAAAPPAPVVDSPAFRRVRRCHRKFSTPVEKPVEIQGFSPALSQMPVSSELLPWRRPRKAVGTGLPSSQPSSNGVNQGLPPGESPAKAGVEASGAIDMHEHDLGRGSRPHRDQGQPLQLLHLVPAHHVSSPTTAAALARPRARTRMVVDWLTQALHRPSRRGAGRSRPAGVGGRIRRGLTSPTPASAVAGSWRRRRRPRRSSPRASSPGATPDRPASSPRYYLRHVHRRPVEPVRARGLPRRRRSARRARTTRCSSTAASASARRT